ncbi:Aldehyde dehydrogenase 12A1 [Heracleum sosnowskyi]|uniref:Aldehyde dehydrogenase 12A1 n=1 Tax=Heracleum sosnowskyi TaxID=360622 RepID=A0AAD8HVX7_9APIA|nr:Aldehyde dehydrogenase 12A1 [Heracleum sosnowskyi]
MSLLETITKASANKTHLTSESNYPILLNSDPILLNLKPQNENSSLLSKCDNGWEISKQDSQIIELGQKFLKTLKIKLKNPVGFSKNEFIKMLNVFLESCGGKIGASVGEDVDVGQFSSKVILKFGSLMGFDVLGLVLEGCVVLEAWDVLESLIVFGFVKSLGTGNLVGNLIVKGRSELVCLIVKHVKDIQSGDVVLILKYFLSPSKEVYGSMVSLRVDWEKEVLEAIEKADDNGVGGKVGNLAKEAAVLLMVAYDGFSASELCLHYLIAQEDLDEVMFLSCIRKLNGEEIMGLIRYLGKWLRKYERFPQANPCPKGASVLGLKACNWVPSLANVVKCFGLVVDETFSSLVLQSEFHEELRSLERVANTLSSEATICSTVTKFVETLKPELKGKD